MRTSEKYRLVCCVALWDCSCEVALILRMRILATLPSVDTSDFRGSFTELLVSCLTKTARGNTKEYFGFEVTTHAIAVRDRALHARPSSPRTRSHRSSRHERAGTFRAASTHTCAGRWGPLPARPREILAGTCVSARPSRPGSRGTPSTLHMRTRRSRSRGSRTTPRRGTTARYARTRPRSRRRTPREPRDARVSRKRVTAWCFFLLDSRFGSVLSNAHSAASGGRVEDISRRDLCQTRRPVSFVSFVLSTKKKRKCVTH